MTNELRQDLRFNSLDLEDMNRVMGRLSDYLDAQEGLRGTPYFKENVDLGGNRIVNASPSQNSTDVVIKQELDQFSPVLISPAIAAYNPSIAETIVGTKTVESVVDNVFALGDGLVYEVGEEASEPGYNIHFTFKGITDFHCLATRVRYDGSDTHYVGLDIYNSTTEDYDQLTLVRNSSSYYEYYTVYGMEDNQYIKAGNVTIRFYHYTLGNVAHNIYVDYVALLKYVV